MLQLKKHDSLDEPPDKPFFHSSKRKIVLAVSLQVAVLNLSARRLLLIVL